MKKRFLLILVALLWCNVGVAESINKSMKELLNDNYKITKEELVVLDRFAYKIFTLKKGRNVIVCSVSIYSTGVRTTSRCMTP
tara:strand:+ start:247 stop:495 length:249 start_codon:yes stop_codon:yes gene_type:complete